MQKYLRQFSMNADDCLKLKPGQIDSILDGYVSQMHEREGSSGKKCLSLVKHGILFFQVMRPNLRHQLKETWSTLKAWEEQSPGNLRNPVPLPVLMALLCCARVKAEMSDDSNTKEKWFRFSALVGLGYFGLFRPGELLGLTRKDICLPNNINLAMPCITISIHRAKNFRQLGHEQFTSIQHPPTCEWVAWLCTRLKDGSSKVWDHTATEFRRCFHDCCIRLHIEKGKYTPASLRAGGATFLFDEMEDTQRLRFLGRWSNIQSLEHYIQSAKANQLMQTLPEKSTRSIERLLIKGGFLLKLPRKFQRVIAEEHNLDSEEFKIDGPIWKTCRDWGRASQKIQESSGDRRSPQRRQIQ